MRVPVSLILAAAVYVVLRCLLLATRPDTVAMPVYELATIGNLAAVTTSGEGTAPLASYYDNCGGHLVTGLLGAASYRVFGESYLALKLVPFALGLVALVLAWRIADRCFGRGAAAVTAFAFALPPPTLFKYSLLAKGNHFENVAFQLGVVWLVLGLSASRARRTRLFAAGVAAGFAIFFYFGSALMLVALCAAHVVAVGVRRAVRDVPLAALGCALGLAPLAWIERATAGRASAFAEAKFGGEAGMFDGFGARLAAFLGDVVPNAGAFESFAGLPPSVAERAYLAAFVVAWCCALVALLRRSEHEPAARAAFAPFVLYPLLFLAAVGASTFDFDVYAKPVEVGRYRYLVPHFAFATILFGAALAWAWRRRGAWRVAAGALGSACFGASLFTLSTIDWSFAETGVIRGYAGAWFRYYPNVALQPTFDAPRGERTWDPTVLPANVARLSPPHRRDVYEGVGQREAQIRLVDPANEFDVAWLDAMLARYEPAHSLDLARGVGIHLRRWQLKSAQVPRLQRALAALAASDSPWAEYVVEGLCLEFGFPLASQSFAEINRSILLGELVPPRLRAAWLRGRGLQLGRLLRRGIPSEVAVVVERAEIAVPEDRPSLWFGLGEGLADAALQPTWPSSVFVWVAPGDRPAFFAGFGAGVRQAWKERAPEFRDALLFGLADDYAREFERGLAWSGYPAPVSY